MCACNVICVHSRVYLKLLMIKSNMGRRWLHKRQRRSRILDRPGMVSSASGICTEPGLRGHIVRAAHATRGLRDYDRPVSAQIRRTNGRLVVHTGASRRDLLVGGHSLRIGQHDQCHHAARQQHVYNHISDCRCCLHSFRRSLLGRLHRCGSVVLHFRRIGTQFFLI